MKQLEDGCTLAGYKIQKKSSLCEISCLLVSVCSVLDGSMCLVSFENALSVFDQNQFYVVMDKNLVK